MITRQQPYNTDSLARSGIGAVWNAGIYCRLSVEDQNLQESGSIQTQKAMLTDYCRQNGLNIIDYYIDDGVSGTSFQRPGFQQMISDIESGRINTVVTKDLSRFGRNYAEAGMYLDHFFVEKEVRFIAPQDNVDTLRKGFDISVPMRNIINDFYAREVSQKTKAARETRARQGMFIASKAPYGYMKDPNDKHHLIIDEDAAEIVRRIFKMAADGAGYNKIARTMRVDNIPNPISYYKQKNPDYDPKGHFKEQCLWHVTSVQKILTARVYLGMLAQCRQEKRGKKHVKKDIDDWIIVEDTHEPLVDRRTWDLVQSQMKNRRRECKNGEFQIFAGLLRCSDCGSALSFSAVKHKTKPDGGQYKCWYYLRHGREHCTPHYISLEQISELVLADIRHHARFAANMRKEYVALLCRLASATEQENLKRDSKEAEKARKRIASLDEIIKKLIEKNVLGFISDERYLALASEYESEQMRLKERLAELQDRLSKAHEGEQNAERFTGLIDKYAGLETLTAPILNELIEQIVVREIIDGKRTQKVEIYYKFIGLADIYA